MIRGIHHVAISTPDLDRLIAFYRDVIGAEVMREGAWPVGSDRIDTLVGLTGSSARTATLRLGNAYLEFFQYETPAPVPQDQRRPVNDHGYTHVCLDVVDIDAEYERLVEAGMTFHCPPPAAGEIGSGSLRSTYGRDPDGNVVEIQELITPDHPLTLPAVPR
ncbi:MAG: VOC family protein [Actinomycetales bacterium]|nr:VOC family protein [Actinomycetales bacterium]